MGADFVRFRPPDDASRVRTPRTLKHPNRPSQGFTTPSSPATTEGLLLKLEPGFPAVNSVLDRARFERGAPFFDVHRESYLRRIVAFHDLVACGVKFADKLVEGESGDRSAAFLLRC